MQVVGCHCFILWNLESINIVHVLWIATYWLNITVTHFKTLELLVVIINHLLLILKLGCHDMLSEFSIMTSRRTNKFSSCISVATYYLCLIIIASIHMLSWIKLIILELCMHVIIKDLHLPSLSCYTSIRYILLIWCRTSNIL